MPKPTVLGAYCPTCTCPLRVWNNGTVRLHVDRHGDECPVRTVPLEIAFRTDGDPLTPTSQIADWQYAIREWDRRRMRRVHRTRAPQRAAQRLAAHQCGWRTEYEELQRQLTQPPTGWYVFGTHIDQPDVRLEFWGDEGGVPIWERPVDA